MVRKKGRDVGLIRPIMLYLQSDFFFLLFHGDGYINFSYVVEFDFPGKDSIRYYNKVPVEKRVFKDLKLFMENKNGSDDLFDRLDVSLQIS